MLKKKNIAMMTAAITAASTVAPAFAATVNRAIETDKDMSDAADKQAVMDTVREALETTYTTDETKLVDEDNAGKTAYSVVVKPRTTTQGVTTNTTVETYSEFEALMNKFKKGAEADIEITSKGYREDSDGNIVDWDVYSFETVRAAQTTPADLNVFVQERLNYALDNNIIKFGPNPGQRITSGSMVVAQVASTPTSGTAAEVEIQENTAGDVNGNNITTTTDAVLKIKGSDVSKNFAAPIKDKNGYIVNFEDAREEIGKIESFVTKTIGVKFTQSTNELTEKVTIDASTLMDEGRLTIEGNELKNKLNDLANEKLRNSYGKLIQLKASKEITTGSIVSAKEVVTTSAATVENMYSLTNNGIEYVDSKNSKIVITVSPDLGYAYKAGYKLTATNATITAGTVLNNTNTIYDTDALAEVTIKGSHAEIKEVFNALNGIANVKTVAGMDRYKTAVETSKAGWGTTGATNVVLVSGEVLVDGLAATPFAAMKDAPILLTQSSELNEDTKAEIQRLGAQNVYIIGGTKAVDTKVADELGKMGLNVERIAGDTRYETSLEVAKRLTSTSTVYVAQGDAMADALSISAVAGQSQSPIILTGKDSISKDALDFLKEEKTRDAYVIGGSDVIEKKVVNQINQVVVNDVNVLGGIDRFETNAKIMDQFNTANKATDVIVVNGDKGLVDALAAGAYAGKTGTTTNATALVLTGDDLTAPQKVTLNTRVQKTTSTKTQIGYGVASKVIKTLTDILK